MHFLWVYQHLQCKIHVGRLGEHKKRLVNHKQVREQVIHKLFE